MKQLLTLAFLLLLGASTSFAQGIAKEKKRNSPHDTIRTSNVTITYGRPYKKGRDIFGGLVEYGKVWRTGADEATKITFNKDVVFGDKPVKAGTYALFTIPGKDSWTVILNKQADQWGAFNYDETQDLVRVTATPDHAKKTMEQFTISTKKHKLSMKWDQTSVSVPMK